MIIVAPEYGEAHRSGKGGCDKKMVKTVCVAPSPLVGEGWEKAKEKGRTGFPARPFIS
jgi:hypothetical protein